LPLSFLTAASFLTGQEFFVTGGAYPLTTHGVG